MDYKEIEQYIINNEFEKLHNTIVDKDKISKETLDKLLSLSTQEIDIFDNKDQIVINKKEKNDSPKPIDPTVLNEINAVANNVYIKVDSKILIIEGLMENVLNRLDAIEQRLKDIDGKDPIEAFDESEYDIV